MANDQAYVELDHLKRRKLRSEGPADAIVPLEDFDNKLHDSKTKVNRNELL